MKLSIFALAAASTVALAQECPTLEIVYARATTEPPQGVTNAKGSEFEAKANRVWSKGFGAAGYSLVTNVTALLPGSSGYAVQYPAAWGQDSPTKGVKDLLQHLATVAARCSKTKFALGGHSQGGFVTVRAIPQIPKETLSRVVAVTMFGSPACPAEVADRCNSYCNKGDFVCDGSGKGGPISLPMGGITPERLVSRTSFALSCEQLESSSEAIKGHVAAKGNAHLAYNADGYYVHRAACYVVSQYKKLGGS